MTKGQQRDKKGQQRDGKGTVNGRQRDSTGKAMHSDHLAVIEILTK